MVADIKVKTYLFTTSSCPNCPDAKKFAEEAEEEIILIEADANEENMKLAQKYGVMAVPMFVEVYGNGSFGKKMLTEYKNMKN